MKISNYYRVTGVSILKFLFAHFSFAQTHGAGAINTLLTVGTVGTGHTFLGDHAGSVNGVSGGGGNNTFIGYYAGRVNGAQTDNVFIGYRAGYNNGSGDTEPKALYNTFVGSDCGYTNTLGGNNTFLGYRAGYTNSIGDANTYIGTGAGYFGTGNSNTFVGWDAGKSNTADYNCFFGATAAYLNTTGSYNSVFGLQAGYNNATGNYNTIMGFQAGYGASSGNNSNNSFYGYKSGYSITSGNSNSFNGYASGYSTTTGGNNTFMGYEAGNSNTTGGSNVFLGYQAGDANTTGSTLTILGYSADVGATGLTNACAIGANAIVKNSNHMILGDNNTKVGINLSNDATGPLSALSVGGNGSSLYEIYALHPTSGDGVTAIRGEVTAPGTSSANKVYAVVGVATANYGTSYGVYAKAYKTTAHANGITYGLYALAGNCTNWNNYAVYAQLGGTNSGWAGYFSGKVETTEDSPWKPTTGMWIGSSDSRLKKDIEPFDDGLNVLRQIDVITFKWNGIGNLDSNKTNIGVIAQQVEPVAPYCIGKRVMKVTQEEVGPFSANIVGTSNDSIPQYFVEVQSFDMTPLLWVTMNAVKELDSTVTALRAQLDAQSNLRTAQPDSATELPVQEVTLSSSRAVLYQNVPNPTNEKTTINYYVSEDAVSAEMVFYDEFGQELQRVTLENKGKASLDVNTVDLNAGIYSYSLVVDGKIIDTKQMIRVR